MASRVSAESRTSQPAPSLTGTSLTGSTLNLASLHGHPVVVDFWASWCGPCRQEQPELKAIVVKYSARGVQFLGVDIRDDNANARAFVQEFKVSYPSVADPASDVAANFGVDAPPTTLVVDSAGNIRLRDLGTLTDVTATLDALLSSG
ncbi:MAG: TlpA family protein disulfide reductase [Candidatus Dormibacteraeota bacterium]|uniref:TlpA family protein disulfide reductase n=1 Tax=Candidatus Amunia macphersoniae TaxID=3127014 RepID=A0A934KLX0_9BACT|nr:TlpA family protein disulfide reductase [Candidatus Dormibacteraeota bacterium]